MKFGNHVQISETQPIVAERLFDRYLGAVLGAAIADALGWMTEFRTSRAQLARKGLSRIEDFTTWSKATGGRFHTYLDYISEGEYSDDTQLTLCTARSLKPDGSFDVERFEVELTAWTDYARGAGAAITSAAQNLKKKKSRWNSNFYGKAGKRNGRGYVDAGGNGAAMRVSPIALANRLDPIRTSTATWANAVTTHGHPRAIVGALTFAEAVRILASAQDITAAELSLHLVDHIRRIALPPDPEFEVWRQCWEKTSVRDLSHALGEAKDEMERLVAAAAAGQRELQALLRDFGCFDPATKGSGTASVAAALATYFRMPSNYEEGVLALVNTMGIDTDTIAAMYGTLVGVRKGSTNIPDRWCSRIQDYEYFLAVADALVRMTLRQVSANPLQVDIPMIMNREDKAVVDLSRSRSISKGQRVVHNLLGPGWVRGVSEQRVRSSGLMLLADIVFDSGQSARFKSFRSGRDSVRQTRVGRTSSKTAQTLLL